MIPTFFYLTSVILSDRFQSRNRETYDSNGRQRVNLLMVYLVCFNLVIEKLMIPTKC